MTPSAPEVEKGIARVRRWYVVLALVSVLILLVAAWGFNRGLDRMTTLARRQQEYALRTQVDMAINAIRPVVDRFVAGEMDREAALEEIRAIGHSLTYEDEFGKNYIFINQQDGVVLVRPYRPDDELRNLWDYQSASGEYVQRIVTQAAAEYPEGSLVSYLFTNPVTGLEEPKLSWLRLVPELDIHVGTGTYMSQAVKDQIGLTRRFFQWGVGLSLLLVFPYVLVMLYLRTQNKLLHREMALIQEKETALEEGEKRYRGIFQSAGDAIFVLDHDRIVEANQQTSDLFGLPPGTLVGRSLLDFSPERQPSGEDSGPAAARLLESAYKGEVLHFEWTHTRADGSPFPVEVSLTRFLTGGRPLVQAVVHDISARKRHEELMQRMNQELERLVDERTAALHEAVEDLSSTIVHLNDARSQLVQTEKLAALGNLVAGIAHELNTPLGNARLAASEFTARFVHLASLDPGHLTRTVYQDHVGSGVELSRALELNIARSLELLQSFKMLAADQRSEIRRQFDLEELLGEAASVLSYTAQGGRVVLDLDVAPGIIMDSYPGVLSQVMIHLVNNALNHAFMDQPNPRILIRAREEVPGRVTLEFSDNGCGMGRETAARVFEPFFTLKLGQGRSGLGMHLSYNLVTRVLQGTITVDSALGQGTRWILDLPRRTG